MDPCILNMMIAVYIVTIIMQVDGLIVAMVLVFLNNDRRICFIVPIFEA
jgi:hypothetical protein